MFGLYSIYLWWLSTWPILLRALAWLSLCLESTVSSLCQMSGYLTQMLEVQKLPGGKVCYWQVLILGSQHYQRYREAEQPEIESLELWSGSWYWHRIIIISPDDHHRPQYNRPSAHTASSLPAPAASRKCAREEFLQHFNIGFFQNLWVKHHLDVIHPITIHKGWPHADC